MVMNVWLKWMWQGKRLESDGRNENDGEVSDEDEGAETSRKSRIHSRTKMKLCRELSNLVAHNRCSSSKLVGNRDKSQLKPSEILLSF